MKTEQVTLDGKVQTVRYEMVGGSLWVHCQGETYCFEPNRRRNQKKGGAASRSEPGILRAQMPGKILKVMVREGDSVSIGQPVLALEAMKMEYVLKSDLDGKVEKLSCSPEEQVVLGQVLCKLVEEK